MKIRGSLIALTLALCCALPPSLAASQPPPEASIGRYVPAIVSYESGFQVSAPLLPARVAEIAQALYEQNRSLAQGTDDDRRVLTRKIAEQTRYELGSEWGTKASSRNNPQSKDAIAMQTGGRLYVWDWQNGSTREPQIRAGQPGDDVTGQYFISVDPVNHLSVGTTPPPSGGGSATPPPVVVACDTSKIEKQAADILASQELILEQLGKLPAVEETVQDTAKSLAEHRKAAQEAKSWAQKWIVERMLPIVGGVVTGWFAK